MMFFVVFLRFPACSNMILDMFRCRTMGGQSTEDSSDDVSMLHVDYREHCGEGQHTTYSMLAFVFLGAYTIGLPTLFLIKMQTFKVIVTGRSASHNYRPQVGKKGEDGYKKEQGHPEVPGNQDYIELAPYKPLLQFFKPNCFRFEIYFWIEKIMLIVMSEAVGALVKDSTGITQWLINMMVTLFFLALIAFYHPWLEHRFNVGNVLMHMLLLYVYMISLLLNPRLAGAMEGSIINNTSMIDASLVISQLALFAFLAVCSFEGLTDLWHQAQKETYSERWAEAMVGDHIEYFEELRLHFGDGSAMLLTQRHWRGEVDHEESTEATKQ